MSSPSNNSSDCYCGISTIEGQKETYIYLCGIRPVRNIKLSPNITLMAVDSSPNPDDMIDCIMKYGNGDEYTLGMLISTLRSVNAQLKISASDAKSLTIDAWNAQTMCVIIGAMLNCEIIWYFQADKPANEFDAPTRLSLICPHMQKFPSSLVGIDEKDCEYLENNISVAYKLNNDAKFGNAANALWNYRNCIRPSTQLSIIWGGIEALFLIERSIKSKLSISASRFLVGNDDMVDKIKLLYEGRCKAVHEYSNASNSVLVNSAALLHQLIQKCIALNSVPNVDELLGDME